MKREFLKNLNIEGLTDEAIDKIMGENGKDVEAMKAKFEAETSEKTALQTTLKERDDQLEKLKTESGAADTLKQQISELQAANAQKEKEYAADMKRIKRESIDDRLLSEAKVRNPIAAKPFLAAIDDGVDDDAYLAVRKQHIEDLTKSESTNFLFLAESAGSNPEPPKFIGTKPGETGKTPNEADLFAKGFDGI